MGKDNILGELYEKNTNKETRKSIGQYYTPNFIIKYILKNTIEKVNILDNPFITVIDISCGSGYFLLQAYDLLKEKFLNSLEGLREKYKDCVYTIEKNGQLIKETGDEYWCRENIHYHLLTHCIYGADKDSTAVELTKIALLAKEPDNTVSPLNIVKCDSLVKWESDFKWKDIENQLMAENKSEKFLLEYKDIDKKWIKKTVTVDEAIEIVNLGRFWSKKYDIVVGNPPYIGHKQLDMEYKEWLLKKYKNVFRDKSDLSFCFFERITDILSPKGVCGIITSRYFMESPTGEWLRRFLQRKTDLIEIIDFYGAGIFKGADIATAIYFFKIKGETPIKTMVKKLRDDSYTFTDNEELESILESKVFEKFEVSNCTFNKNRWILLSDESRNIYNKIEEKTKYKLGNIAMSFQGIITGRDKAFVLNSDEIKRNNIEKRLLRPWIKNSDVKRYEIQHRDKYLIYSNLIEDIKDYPNSLEYIGQHRERLENRRECKNGTREWYELQWGRDRKLFEEPKIVFPYKSNANRFALDLNGFFSSADVYSLIIKDELKEIIPLEYLVGLLNSNIYEFYFKLFAKKMGKGIYDYYPNSVMDLKIFTEDIIDTITERTKKIIRLLSNKKLGYEDDIADLEEEINIIIASYLNLSNKEYQLIKKAIS